MMKLKKWGLQLKLSIPLAVISTVILVGFGVFNFNSEKRELFIELEDKTNGALNKLKTNLVGPFLDMEDDSIRGILRSEINDVKEIVGIQIWDENEKELHYSAGRNEKEQIVEKGWLKKQVFREDNFKKGILKNKDSDEVLGLIMIYWSDKLIKNKLRKELTKVIIEVLLIDIFLFLSIFILLKMLILKPLKEMAEYAGKLELKNLRGPDLILKKRFSHDEIDDLADTLNKMKSDLQSAQSEVLNYTDNLEKTVRERTNDLKRNLDETNGMLSNINKAIFRVDSKGTILEPASSFSKKVFYKDIVGSHALKLLFFHFKDGSIEKKELVDSFLGVFGNDENKYKYLKSGLPTKITVPDKRKKKGKVLEISYVPLFDNESKVEKLMFIVDDVTQLEQAMKELKGNEKKLNSLNDLIFFHDKTALAKDLPFLIVNCVDCLADIHKTEPNPSSIKKITDKLIFLTDMIKSKVIIKMPRILKLLNEFSWNLESVDDWSEDFYKNVTSINIEEDLTNIILQLNLYFDEIKNLKECSIYPVISFNQDFGFTEKVNDKLKDFERIIVNLLEYVFLVRSIDDLTDENIGNAPKKVRLYGEFDNIIDMICKRSKLISFSLKITGNEKKSKSFWELSELLKQMPSKDKVTEAALINNLIEPYKKVKQH